ncbi:transposase family protein [Catellatospora sp. NPDC049609]|uniref:transposase family protein n=1 Tax=Catellatospora sp. NPDC049609 TaxID=3155505 RepID=UPI003412E85A
MSGRARAACCTWATSSRGLPLWNHDACLPTASSAHYGSLDTKQHPGRHHHCHLPGPLDRRSTSAGGCTASARTASTCRPWPGDTGDRSWISDGLPGSTHDLTAARQHGVIDAAIRHGLQLWADRGYQGEAPTLITSVRAGKDKPLIPAATAYNRRHAAVRAPGERGFATLECWQILTRVRCTNSKTGTIAQAILALHHRTSTPIRMK